MTYQVKVKGGKTVKVVCDYTFVTNNGDVLFLNRGMDIYGESRGVVVAAFAVGMWTGYVKA